MRYQRVVWSPVEEEFLRKNRGQPINQLTIQLAKSRNAIKKKLAEFDGKLPKKEKDKVKGRSRIGKREDCGGMFFRSSWEANFYRYLKKRSDVLMIEYEPHDFSFWQFGHKKGTVTYTPDFKVTFKDKSWIWVEVKGGMLKATDKTKIRRFKKYYPDEFTHLVALAPGKNSKTVEFFRETGVKVRWHYPEFRKTWRKKIKGWED